MTHEEVMEQVEAQIDTILLDLITEIRDRPKDEAWMVTTLRTLPRTKQIVSLPEIVIKDPDQSLPRVGEFHNRIHPHLSGMYKATYINGMEYLKGKENWVRVLPKEEK